MPAVQDKRWTAREVEALQDADPTHRYQVVDGELLVSPGPTRTHQRAVAQLFKLVDAYVERWDFGETLTGPGQVSPDEYTWVQPDVFVLPLGGGNASDSWDTNGRLLLACEVLSPSTARFDRVKKRPKYQAMGAAYWIVDTDARVFEEWLPGAAQPNVHDREVRWRAAEVPDDLVIDLPAFFRKVFREGSRITG